MEIVDYHSLSVELKSKFLKLVIELDRREFPWPWSSDDWLGLDSLSRYRLFLLVKEGVLFGFTLFDYLVGDSSTHLLKIAVRRDQQGIGLGRRLLQLSCSSLANTDLKFVYLEVSSKNSQAIFFYEKFGFSIIRTIKKFYLNGDDAFAMQCSF